MATIVGTLMLCASITVYDGDTPRCDGASLRPMGPGSPNKTGFDTPEINHRAECNREHALGMRARERMVELIATPGLRIVDSGELDHFQRPLVWLLLPDNTTVGARLLAEGHAQEWPNTGNVWCERRGIS